MGVVLAGLILSHTILVGYSATCHSPPLDEVGHFAGGIDVWCTGRFDLYRVNPPLVRCVATFPVWCGGVSGPVRVIPESESRPEFDTVRQRLDAYSPHCLWWFAVARWACLPFTWLGAYVCFRWAKGLYGAQSGLVAAALWCFCPNVLAHAAFITPDTGATAVGLGACYLFWRWLSRPRWPTSLAVGGALGLALLCKSTWVLLYGLWPGIWLVCRLTRQREALPRGPLAAQAVQLGLALAFGTCVVNAGYLFQGTLQPVGSYQFISAALSGKPVPDVYGASEMGNRFAGSMLAWVPVPFPSDYIRGVDYQKWEFERGYLSYLRGEWRRGGWWYYYLYAAAIKIPCGVWVLLGLSLVSIVRAGVSRRSFFLDGLPLAVPMLGVFVLVSSQTGMNHHFRYVLPCLPFAFVLASGSVRQGTGGASRLVAVGALTWSVGSSIAITPHHLSYFNELVGGPARGPEHLLNSNIDWGQDMVHLRRWLEDHPEVRSIGVSARGCIDPKYVGINAFPVPGRTDVRPGPLPGWYAVRVDALFDSSDEYAYFRQLRPVNHCGYSIAIYQVTYEDAVELRRRSHTESELYRPGCTGLNEGVSHEGSVSP